MLCDSALRYADTRTTPSIQDPELTIMREYVLNYPWILKPVKHAHPSVLRVRDLSDSVARHLYREPERGHAGICRKAQTSLPRSLVVVCSRADNLAYLRLTFAYLRSKLLPHSAEHNRRKVRINGERTSPHLSALSTRGHVFAKMPVDLRQNPRTCASI